MVRTFAMSTNQFFKFNRGIGGKNLKIPKGLSKETIRGYKVIIKRVLKGKNIKKRTKKSLKVQKERLRQLNAIKNKLEK